MLIDVPKTMDISHLRGCGIQPGEVELPADSSSSSSLPQPGIMVMVSLCVCGGGGGRVVMVMYIYYMYTVVLDEGTVMQLVSMGFDVEGCKKAVYHTSQQQGGGGVEPAMNWVLEHMGDPGN